MAEGGVMATECKHGHPARACTLCALAEARREQEECCAENARLTAEVERLRDALSLYGVHRYGCDKPYMGSIINCTCGLDAALVRKGE